MSRKRKEPRPAPSQSLRAGEPIGRREFVLTTGGIIVATTGLETACGSSNNTTAPKTADPTTSVVSVSAGSIPVSGKANLTLQAKDATGANLSAGGATVAFTASGGTATGTISATTDHGDGTYTAVYTATAAGTAQTIGATIDGTAVTTTLPTLAVTATSPVPDATKCVVTATPSSIAVAATSTLTLQAKDASGSNLSIGGAVVVFTATGGTSSGTISPTTDNGDGTYTAVYTGTAAGTAQTIRATINGTAVSTTMPTVTVTSAFQAADVVNNASFESGFEGFTDFGANPPAGCTRDTTRAYVGAISILRNLPVTSGSDIGGALDYHLATAVDRLWTRFYFYLDAAIDGTLKFHQLYDSGYNTQFSGLYLSNGNLSMFFTPETQSAWMYITTQSTLRGGWHSIELDYWRNGDPSGFPSAAIYLDNTQITSLTSGTPPSPFSWINGRLNFGARASTNKIANAHWLGVLNGSPPNTVPGNVWVDQVSISTLGRIGP